MVQLQLFITLERRERFLHHGRSEREFEGRREERGREGEKERGRREERGRRRSEGLKPKWKGGGGRQRREEGNGTRENMRKGEQEGKTM